ncbi:MAG: hypothetical protein ICV87_02080 [Gemmatimonadetes bacterium]|nr:hypothetical protein [Gemmatimonadota bacterium]
MIPVFHARAARASAAFAAVLLAASLQAVQVRLGTPAAIVYAGVVIAAAFLPARTLRSTARALSARPHLWLALLTGLLVAAFAVVYPVANRGALGGGSDRDDALNLAVRALLRDGMPYRERTYLGNPVTPLPGALVLAMPFVLLGNAALQVLFWVPALAVSVGRAVRDRGAGLLLVAAALLLCPDALRDVLGGGDYFANAAYVVVALVAAHEAARVRAGVWIEIGAAALLGLALFSRPNFVLLWPLAAASLARVAGRRGALLAVVAAAVGGAVTLPLYLADPAGFTPLHTADKLRQFDQIVPHAAFWITSATAAAAVLLPLRSAGGRLDVLLFHCACVQAVPLAAAAVLALHPSYRAFSDLTGSAALLVPLALVPFWCARATAGSGTA